MSVEFVTRPSRVSEREERLVRSLDVALSRDRKARVIAPTTGEQLVLPRPVFEALRQAVHLLAQGKAVAIVPYGRMLTTQEAADLLNVSRPYLVKLLREGVMPFEPVGTHRRIRFEDLMRYRARRDRERKERLDRLAQISQDYGLYE